MRKIYALMVLLFAVLQLPAQVLVQGRPHPTAKPQMVSPRAIADGTFTMDMIENWSGEGANRAAFVVQWNAESETSALVWANGLLSGKCYYQWKNQQAIQLTDDLFANDSFCMAGLRTKTIGIYEKGTGRKITCNVEGYPYALIWSAPAKPVRFVCIEPWHSLPAAETDPQQWSQRAAAACLAPGESWETTLSTTFER